MATPSAPNPISINDINIELGSPGTTTRTLNDAAVRSLAGTPFSTPGTTISLNDLRGKSLLINATGGVTPSGITPGNGYRYHVFISPGTFTVNSGSGTVEYLIVAGGASGGGHYGGGGGAGGVLSSTTTVSPGPYSVSVGGGGPASTGYTTPNALGKNGGNSSFGAITATGGGGGAARGWPGAASPGGSGGGATQLANPGTGGSGIPGQGFPGSPSGSPNEGSGGGGAGGAGSPSNTGAQGGPGAPFPAFAAPLISPQIPTGAPWVSAVGPTGLYGGGGGGGDQDSPGGTGGPGGGGTGGGPQGTPGAGGIQYTGGGGGGAGQSESGSYSGAGATGLVVIRYLV